MRKHISIGLAAFVFALSLILFAAFNADGTTADTIRAMAGTSYVTPGWLIFASEKSRTGLVSSSSPTVIGTLGDWHEAPLQRAFFALFAGSLLL